MNTPPAPPAIPVGLATKLGLIGTTLAALIAAVTAIINGDHTPETITAGVTAAFLLYGTVRGRMDQAAAAVKPAPIVNITPPAPVELLPARWDTTNGADVADDEAFKIGSAAARLADTLGLTGADRPRAGADLADAALDEPGMGNVAEDDVEPEVNAVALEGRTADSVEDHAAGERRAYSEFGQPEAADIEANRP